MSIGNRNLQEAFKIYVRPVSFAGTVGPASSTTLVTVKGANLVPDQFTGLLLEITSGITRGDWSKVIGNTANAITVAPALSAAPAEDATFAIVSYGVITQNIVQWGSTALTGRDVTLDLAELSSHKCVAFTQGAVEVGTLSTLIVPENVNRKHLVICNDSMSVVYLGLGSDAVLHNGIRLNAEGGAYEIGWTNLSKVPIYGICETGTATVTFSEGV